jgi:predicted nucleic acid-binding protein
LLDTNIVSYFLKGINNGLITRMELGFKAQNIAISAVTRAELQHPALRAYCRPEA